MDALLMVLPIIVFLIVPLGALLTVLIARKRLDRPVPVSAAITFILLYFLLLVLGSFLIYPFGRVGESTRRAACTNNVRQIGLALIQCAGDNDGRFPAMLGTLLEKKYLTTTKVFVCPSSRDRFPDAFIKAYENSKEVDYKKVEELGSYVYVKGLLHTGDNELMVLFDKPGAYNGEGRNVFFDDGHVRWYPEAEFERLMKAQEEKLRKLREKPPAADNATR